MINIKNCASSDFSCDVYRAGLAKKKESGPI